MGNSIVLGRQLDQLLSDASGPVPGARVILGPHAGYTYCGTVLAKAYKAFDPTNIKRVFILGPSHHVYFTGSVMTSGCAAYETPLGNVPVDVDTIKELQKEDPSMFKKMTPKMEEDEHCFEMHMPFLYKVTEHSKNGVPKIIPIMICGSNEKFERKLAQDLKPYFEDKENAFIVTSDFCHWGVRFDYTAYSPDGTVESLGPDPYVPEGGIPIYKSIEAIDRKAMEVASTGSFKDFRNYLDKTENTICGAKPLSVVLALMEGIDGKKSKFQWNGYGQSSHVTSPMESSVSYASSYATV